jgi:hypothetical protein
LPTNPELASLVIIILYLDQLWPETEESLAHYPWHQTSDFAHDINLARGFARSICFQANELDGNFSNTFKDRELTLIELCNKLANTKMEQESVVHNQNFYEDIFGKVHAREDSGSDSSMDEDEGELSADSESSNL